MAPHRGRRRNDPARLLGVMGGAMAIMLGVAVRDWYRSDVMGEEDLANPGRHLLASAWNPLHREANFKGPLGTIGIIAWIPLTVWLFLGVAIVADEYFTPALEKISEALDLSADVAGATFLAAASSAPEFFTSFADTFLASEGGEGFGIGTIVGSAVFNILIICAVSCIPASGEAKRASPNGKYLSKAEFLSQGHSEGDWNAANASERAGSAALDLDWYPLARDTVFYVLSIIVLILTVATNEPEYIHRIPQEPLGCVHWFESLFFIILYAGYILTMKFSGRIDAKSRVIKDRIFGTNESGQFPEKNPKPRKSSVQKMGDSGNVHPPGRHSIPKLPFTPGAALIRRNSDMAHHHGVHVDGDSEMHAATPTEDHEAKKAGVDGENSSDHSHAKEVHEAEGSEEEEEDDMSPFWESTLDVPDTFISKFFWVLSLPYNIAFRLTIPTVTRGNVKDHYVLAFSMCILWIAMLSAFMVKVVSWIGTICGVDSVVMGLVVLAAGTSVPDALGSYNEAKRGEANAAVSNALGSNVFDICIGLGVPWFVYSLAFSRCFAVCYDNTSLISLSGLTVVSVVLESWPCLRRDLPSLHYLEHCQRICLWSSFLDLKRTQSIREQLYTSYPFTFKIYFSTLSKRPKTK